MEIFARGNFRVFHNFALIVNISQTQKLHHDAIMKAFESKSQKLQSGITTW